MRGILDILPVQTGYVWFDVVVYIVSGGAFVVLCYLVPRWLRNMYRDFKAIL